MKTEAQPASETQYSNELRRWTKSKERTLLHYVTACLNIEMRQNCVLGSDITYQQRRPQHCHYHCIPNSFTQNGAKSGGSEVTQQVGGTMYSRDTDVSEQPAVNIFKRLNV